MKEKMVVILGPTATGKTRIAALLAYAINGEILSADSRQLYRKMDIGTGKDLKDYLVNNVQIKAHLIDIADAGEKFSLFQYKVAFDKAYQEVLSKGKIPIVCGGSGMYLETALGLYDLKEVKEDENLRNNLKELSKDQLIEMLKSKKALHNTTDITDKDRLIRAIEIAENEQGKNKGESLYDHAPCTEFIYGIDVPRDIVRSRITNRLETRLKEGLIDEVKQLIDEGVSAETMQYYGLEYKYVTLYVQGELSYNRMVELLNTAIHQFAKRQMTWFRRMKRRGVPIKWLPNDPDQIIQTITTDLS